MKPSAVNGLLFILLSPLYCNADLLNDLKSLEKLTEVERFVFVSRVYNESQQLNTVLRAIFNAKHE